MRFRSPILPCDQVRPRGDIWNGDVGSVDRWSVGKVVRSNVVAWVGNRTAARVCHVRPGGLWAHEQLWCPLRSGSRTDREMSVPKNPVPTGTWFLLKRRVFEEADNRTLVEYFDYFSERQVPARCEPSQEGGAGRGRECLEVEHMHLRCRDAFATAAPQFSDQI